MRMLPRLELCVSFVIIDDYPAGECNAYRTRYQDAISLPMMPQAVRADLHPLAR